MGVGYNRIGTVETWSQRTNQLNHSIVGGNGQVLDVQSRTNNLCVAGQDCYKVFTEHPDATDQTEEPGAGAGNAESPDGWLSGGQKTTNISGNNVHAYLDTRGNNRAARGGSSVSNGLFLTAADLGAEPSTTTNRAVAVQNLFWLNNVIHDELYRHGFDEAAGNFQEDNFGAGGAGSDSVNAEAQDGGGLDNANFATPADGSNPRMQMYLWTGRGDHQVAIASSDYLAMGAEFGPSLNATGIIGDVIVVNDGDSGDGTGTNSDGCEPIVNNVQIFANIALIDRGYCAFVIKVKNAQDAGAIGVIVANNQGDDILTMGGSDNTVTISSVFVGQSDGDAIRNAVGNASLTSYTSLMKDGDLDGDIVMHEYGHGLSWRTVGTMTGFLGGAIGEGASDGFAIINYDDDVVGEYSMSHPIGIRTEPYAAYSRSYGDWCQPDYPNLGDCPLGGVHYNGEIYAAIMWKMWILYQSSGISQAQAQDQVLDDIVAGMKATTYGLRPTPPDMRDGILTAISGSPTVAPSDSYEFTRWCDVWEAFAGYGVGENQQTSVWIDGAFIYYQWTENFDVPTACEAGPGDSMPSVSIHSPDGIDPVSGDVIIEVTASDVEDDDASLEVEVRIDDGPWVVAPYNGSTQMYERSWDTNAAAEGGHTIDARATDSATNMKAAVQVGVTVDNIDDSPQADFSVTCTNLICSFTDLSTDDNGIQSRFWEFGDGNNSNQQNPSHTYAAAGTYTVKLTVIDNGNQPDSIIKSATPTESGADVTLDLAGNSINNGSTWTAEVTATVTVGDANGKILTGTWSAGASGEDLCIISGNSCTVSMGGIRKKNGSATFTVNTIGLLDLDGETSIIVLKP